MQMKMKTIEKEAFELIDRIWELSPYEKDNILAKFTDQVYLADEGSGVFYVGHDQVLIFLERRGIIGCLGANGVELRYWWPDEKSSEGCISGYMRVFFDRASRLKQRLEGRVPTLDEGILKFLGKELDLSNAEMQLKFVMCLLKNLNSIVPKKELVSASGLGDDDYYEEAKKAKKLTKTFDESLKSLKKEVERKLKEVNMEEVLLIVAKSGSYGLFVDEHAVERALKSRQQI